MELWVRADDIQLPDGSFAPFPTNQPDEPPEAVQRPDTLVELQVMVVACPELIGFGLAEMETVQAETPQLPAISLVTVCNGNTGTAGEENSHPVFETEIFT